MSGSRYVWSMGSAVDHDDRLSLSDFAAVQLGAADRDMRFAESGSARGEVRGHGLDSPELLPEV